ncbi:N-fatty-acyl-amino acid synthase/hydrolase PM20D1 [Macaca thibetana thibetana]|uniref:N-fatty-acyl-amino acid synthase/hydrolase PM20D1 n=1 Tax=Macaca thibetana thibetana TaxID=257877 RepID=UPI0021BC6B50|nr:N-fatty-acyl-amino acid synthase/hydrolase PM20D1 [Macaca thibetana thibetana]
MAQRCLCVLALAAMLLLVFATVSRSMGLRSDEHQRASRIPAEFSKEELVAMKEALKGAIQIPTVTFSYEKANTTALVEFGKYIYKVFPTVLSTSFIQHEVVEEYSHLFTIKGSDPSLQPYLLMAHFDVVPAPEEGWEVPPFSGLEREGAIYGRGTLDDKNSVMALLQALELLLIKKYIPRRSFFISLGHDEESSGTGAQKVSALLQSRGVQLAFVVDEGGFILDDFIPDFKKPIALIGVSEKGSMNLLLQVNMSSGHSSAPPKETSIGILAAAVSRLEQTPMPIIFGSGTLVTVLRQMADEFPFPVDKILSNPRLFEPLITRFMEKNPLTNAMIRTTTALTIFEAGIKVNVIPSVAKATVNFRIHSGQTVQEVLELTKNIVADNRVQFHVMTAFDPLPISPYDDKALGYQLLRQTIQSVFPEVNITIPGTCLGNTDSRFFTDLTTGIYRFNPYYLQPEDLKRFHGINEKISVQGYENQVKFIFELIQNADTDQEPVSHLHKL